MKPLALIAVVLLTPLLAFADPPPQIADATQRYEASLRQAELNYSRTLLGIKRNYIQELQRGILAATKAGNLDAANTMSEIKKGVEAEINNLPLLGAAVTHVSISATGGWQDGAMVRKGDRVKIVATGSWCLNTHRRSTLTFGPAGSDHEMLDVFLKKAPSGCLLGQLATVVSVVGPGAEFTAPQDGMLKFRVNDSDDSLGNDDGAIDVTITVGNK